MTTNTYEVIDMVTREALEVLKNKLGLGNRCLRQYDKSFGEEGAKIGDTLRIRIPPRFTTTSGPAPTLQNFVQTQVPVAAQSQYNVGLEFTTKDLSLSFDSFKEQFIEPTMAQLATSIDTLGFNALVSNTITSGTYAGNYSGFTNLVTPGNVSATTGPASWTGAAVGQTALSATNPAQSIMSTFFGAQARLTNQAAPQDKRWAVLSPNATAASLAAQVGLFNPNIDIGDQFKEGMLGMQAGAIWHTSPNVPNFTSGNWAGGTPVVATTSVDGANTLAVSGFTSGATILAGDQFVIAGVYEVNPLTRASTGALQVFTVIANGVNNGSGGFTLSIAPTINSPTSPQYQTVNSLPTSGETITMMGTANTSTAVNVMYQEQALCLVTAPLADVSDAGAMCVRVEDPEDGFSMRFVKQYQALIDQVVPRIDVLVGWAVTRPSLGVRIQG